MVMLPFTTVNISLDIWLLSFKATLINIFILAMMSNRKGGSHSGNQPDSAGPLSFTEHFRTFKLIVLVF